MALPGLTTQTPTQIRTVNVHLSSTLVGEFPAGPFTDDRKVSYSLQILDENGQEIRHKNEAGNLAPHLTAQQISDLNTFMDAVRVLAEALLP
jgi:hypothetical protein